MGEKCLLLNPELGIGHGAECCCNCANQHQAKVCNCAEYWPDTLIIERCQLNNRHGLIGWACIIDYEGKREVEIKRHEHGGCELWRGKGEA